MLYSVRVKKKTEGGLRKLPQRIKEQYYLLVKDLMESGPFQSTWPNYSPLKNNKFHCHLNYNYVACWSWNKGTITIEVYYVGSRENAPY